MSEEGYSAHDAHLIEREAGEATGIGDSVSTTLRKENGIVIKGPDPDEWGWREEALAAEREESYRAKSADQLKEEASQRNLSLPAKVKKEDVVALLVAHDASQPPEDGLPQGFVSDTMKGPDPKIWARDDNGNYANR